MWHRNKAVGLIHIYYMLSYAKHIFLSSKSEEMTFVYKSTNWDHLYNRVLCTFLKASLIYSNLLFLSTYPFNSVTSKSYSVPIVQVNSNFECK